eukprot:765133-Hanusia_phi.AAC.2
MPGRPRPDARDAGSRVPERPNGHGPRRVGFGTWKAAAPGRAPPRRGSLGVTVAPLHCYSDQVTEASSQRLSGQY